MLKTGLVSITFRQLKPEQIVRLVRDAGLDGIEWGGDIHAPHGDLAAARAVSAMTADMGLTVAAYGSYYRAGCNDPDFVKLKSVVETAAALGAPTIRMWAGEKGSAQSTEADRARVAGAARAAAALAAEAGLTVSFEFHGDTLTDSNGSALRFYQEAGSDVKAYWQPDYRKDASYRASGLESLKPLLTNLHLFHWTFGHDGTITRNALAGGHDELKTFIDSVADLPGDHFAMIEFVRGDDPEQFREDAEELRRLIGQRL